jgi:hypothetical protein
MHRYQGPRAAQGGACARKQPQLEVTVRCGDSCGTDLTCRSAFTAPWGGNKMTSKYGARNATIVCSENTGRCSQQVGVKVRRC